MKTVNSLSGGKTSSYLAMHYPADYNLFSLVCNDDPKCAHPDKKVMQLANDKLIKTSARHGEFIGTPENYKTVKVILDLEQKIGSEIIWVRDKSFDWWIKKLSILPNFERRWCTSNMKLKPIFEWCLLNTDFPVNMRIGYRHDEKHRVDRFTTDYKSVVSCKNFGKRQQNWKDFIDWRVGKFPLIEDKVEHYKIFLWSLSSGIEFPEDSNCQMCFHKNPQQLRKNFDDANPIMQWAKRMELETGGRFEKDLKMSQIEKIGLQEDFNFGTGSGCNSGGCTD